jgi:hypothetical protein
MERRPISKKRAIAASKHLTASATQPLKNPSPFAEAHKRQNANMHSQKCYISRPGNLQIGKISQEHPQLNCVFTNLKETKNYEDTQGAFLSFLVMICY